MPKGNSKGTHLTQCGTHNLQHLQVNVKRATCYVIAAMLEDDNKRYLISYYYLFIQHGRHLLDIWFSRDLLQPSIQNCVDWSFVYSPGNRTWKFATAAKIPLLKDVLDATKGTGLVMYLEVRNAVGSNHSALGWVWCKVEEELEMGVGIWWEWDGSGAWWGRGERDGGDCSDVLTNLQNVWQIPKEPRI